MVEEVWTCILGRVMQTGHISKSTESKPVVGAGGAVQEKQLVCSRLSFFEFQLTRVIQDE